MRVLMLAVAMGLWALPARAQLISERADGLSRVCVYADPSRTTNTTTESVRTGIGQNCPITRPLANSNLAVPPTAQLLSQSIAGEQRICVYAEAGTRWSFTLSLSQPCPIAAGMLPSARGPDNGRRQPSNASSTRQPG